MKKAKRKQVGNPEAAATEVPAQPAFPAPVSLIGLSPSRGDVMLDTLKLEFSQGRPAVLWVVSWRGGFSHADSAGRYELLPDELLENLTAPMLAAWMKKELTAVNDLQNMEVYAMDPRVVKWCKQVRAWLAEQGRS